MMQPWQVIALVVVFHSASKWGVQTNLGLLDLKANAKGLNYYLMRIRSMGLELRLNSCNDASLRSFVHFWQGGLRSGLRQAHGEEGHLGAAGFVLLSC
jgi:hypothetical protein